MAGSSPPRNNTIAGEPCTVPFQSGDRMKNAIRLVIGLALAWTLAPAAADAQAFQMLSVFPSGSGSDPAPDGAVPVAGLIKVGKYLYGTAASGANIFHEPPWGCGFSNGCGSIFSVNAVTGKLTTLYKFCSLANCADGGHPLAGLVYRDGSFYGTTETGGNSTAGSGAGTVYKLTQDGGGAWVETVLYNFCSTKIYCRDGNNPSALLVFDSAGMLYGTTAGGRADDVAPLHRRYRWQHACSRIGVRQGGRSLRHDGVWRRQRQRHGVQTQANDREAGHDSRFSDGVPQRQSVLAPGNQPGRGFAGGQERHALRHHPVRRHGGFGRRVRADAERRRRHAVE